MKFFFRERQKEKREKLSIPSFYLVFQFSKFDHYLKEEWNRRKEKKKKEKEYI